MKRILTALLLTLPLLAACSQKQGEVQAVGAASAPMKSPRAPQAAMLAYEHHVSVSLGREDIPPRLKAVQAACDQHRFGQCTVLDMSEQGGDYASASITVRLVPDGVEPATLKGRRTDNLIIACGGVPARPFGEPSPLEYRVFTGQAVADSFGGGRAPGPPRG